MMTATTTIGGYEFEFAIPPTSSDVLDWHILARAVDCGDLELTLIELGRRGLQWACQWLQPAGWEWEELSALMMEISDAEHYMGNVVALCDAIAKSAGLADDVLQGIAAMLDKQNEVPKDWRPDGVCTCARCRKGIANPRGMACVYDDFDPRSITAAALVSSVENGADRHYINQIKAIFARAESRRLSYERKKREDEEEYAEIMKRKGLMRG